jgi:hypothetical protein
VSAVMRLELRLALLELKEKIRPLGLGIALGLAGAIVALFALGFGFATVASALETVLPNWLALLIVTAGLVLLASALGALALRAIRKGVPPIPEEAIEEAKKVREAVTANGSRRSG